MANKYGAFVKHNTPYVHIPYDKFILSSSFNMNELEPLYVTFPCISITDVNRYVFFFTYKINYCIIIQCNSI